jgi:hypothetical protein
MIKKLFILFVVVAALTSCTGSSSKKAYNVDELMDTIGTQVDKEVTVYGTVTHVCVHTAKKCFIENENKDLSIRINAGGIIDVFDRDIIGSRIEAVGVVKEQRIEKEQIDETEKTAHENMDNEEAHDQCETMLKQVAQMRAWMEKNKKDYYANYYIDGIRYKVL